MKINYLSDNKTILEKRDVEELIDSVKDNVLKNKYKTYKTPTWLSRLEKGGKVVALPSREEIDPTIKERLIIELYSR